MSASNELEAESPTHAQGLADRRDAKRWRMLRAADPSWLTRVRESYDAPENSLLAERDHHFARAERASDEKFADAVAAENELTRLREALNLEHTRAEDAENEAASTLADLAAATSELRRVQADLDRAHTTITELRTVKAAAKGELIR